MAAKHLPRSGTRLQLDELVFPGAVSQLGRGLDGIQPCALNRFLTKNKENLHNFYGFF